tara:strand:+ start:53 stop:643 length:591 start_codon:yes stop_codon:yes gene_type:complete
VKLLTARAKAKELHISMRALAKSRHLYRYIQKSPRKFLYFEEDPQEAIRPTTPGGSDSTVKSRYRRRGVDPKDTNYHKVKNTGDRFKLLNQMRAKLSLEGKFKKEELNDFSEALAHKVKENYLEINEQRKTKIRSELMAQEETARKRDPRRYGQIYNPKLVRPRYNKDILNDQREDRENREKSFTDTLPGVKKSYY